MALIGQNQILVEKQLPCALTDATPSTTGQLHQSLFHDVDGIDKVSLSECKGPSGEGQPTHFTMLTDQGQWCLGVGACAHAPEGFMGDQPSPDVSRMISNQSTIQLQLLLAVIALQPMQGRQLRSTGSPVVTYHQPGELGMHLQATQTTPSKRSPVT